jgi:hypothetical protein
MMSISSISHILRRSLFAFALVLVTLALPAFAQSVPNWNVTLPADPGTATQAVSLASGILTVNRKFSTGSFHFAVPLKSVRSITEPYLYKKNWLIDLHLTKKISAVNTMNAGMVQTMDTDEPSLLFLNKADAAAGRAYLLTRSGARP